jgi:hypothetical protein
MKDDTDLCAQIIGQAREIMKGYPTQTNITACFNIMAGLLNLCSVRMRKKSVMEIADKFHAGMIEHIEELYNRRKLDK